MFVSALFRSGSTHFCKELATELNLIFLDEVYDPLNADVLRLKRLNHECTDLLKTLDKSRLSDIGFQKQLWENHDLYLVNNHNYDIPWFDAAQLFFARRDLVGALSSMHKLIVRSKMPESNISFYVSWMKRFIEYSVQFSQRRKVVFAEQLGYVFRESEEGADLDLKNLFYKKIDQSLYSEFLQLEDDSLGTVKDLACALRK